MGLIAVPVIDLERATPAVSSIVMSFPPMKNQLPIKGLRVVSAMNIAEMRVIAIPTNATQI